MFSSTGTHGGEFKPNGPTSPTTLFLPAAGHRVSFDGTLDAAGTIGYYWSSGAMVVGGGFSSPVLSFAGWQAFFSNGNNRAYGNSLRCVADE